MVPPLRARPLSLAVLLLAGCGGSGGGPASIELQLAGTAAREGQVLSSGGVLAGNAIIVGDGAINQVLRGFISFDLSPLPAGATLVSASLQISQFLVIGTPYSDLGAMVADHVDLGAGLNSADFGAVPILSAVATLFTTPALGTSTVDVTESVRDDLANARTRTEFRLRFAVATNGDAGQDTSQVGGTAVNDEPTQPPLRLILRYEP